MKYLIAKIGTHSSTRILHTGGRLKEGNQIEFMKRGDSYWAARRRAWVSKILRKLDGSVWLVKLEL